MRMANMWSFLAMVQIGAGAWGGSGTASAGAETPLVIIPTKLQELRELRINTGERAVLSDGTMNAVYVKHIPSEGKTYLNFHVDLASEAGPVVLSAQEIRLVGGTIAPVTSPAEGSKEKATPATGVYTPLDWFIDTGLAEVRGDSLTVRDKAIVQFTIEVPLAGLDDLVLQVRSQRVGTVKEIRERIARAGGVE